MDMRRFVVFVVVGIALCLFSAEALAEGNIWYSVAVPGWGQVRAGHYGRGSLFLSAELMSLSALAISNIQYNRAVEQYDRARASYLHAIYIGDAVYYYDLAHEKWDDAERLHGYRQAAVAAAVGVWFVNILDMILFDEKEEPLLSLEAQPGGFLVTGSLSF
jgi:hypothetical protein